MSTSGLPLAIPRACAEYLRRRIYCALYESWEAIWPGSTRSSDAVPSAVSSLVCFPTVCLRCKGGCSRKSFGVRWIRVRYSIMGQLIANITPPQSYRNILSDGVGWHVNSHTGAYMQLLACRISHRQWRSCSRMTCPRAPSHCGTRKLEPWLATSETSSG